MSLVHRSGSIEHIEPGWRSRSVSPAGSQRRTLSFNPVDGGAWSQPAHEELVPAFEVGGTKRACEYIHLSHEKRLPLFCNRQMLGKRGTALAQLRTAWRDSHEHYESGNRVWWETRAGWRSC